MYHINHFVVLRMLRSSRDYVLYKGGVLRKTRVPEYVFDKVKFATS